MGTPGETSRATILVADDDQDLVGYLKLRLEREGYQVLVANDGDEALELALDHRPDLAVIDVRMPNLDGVAVTRQIRANEDNRIPVILLTGETDEEHRSRGYEAGATDYLTKPFNDPDELVRHVRSALEAGAAG